MDYEKKYKEALERAKEIIECSKPDTKEVRMVLSFFPELAKSENEQSKNWILEYLYDGLRKSDEQFKDQFKTAIAWIKKQGEQKPAEWSEEDEDILDGIIEDIEVLKEEESNKDVKAAYQREIDWLKSLRPQTTWKPNNDQLYALNYVLDYHVFGDINIREKVQSLYDELKKI